MEIRLKNGELKNINEGLTLKELARELNLVAPDQALVCKIDGRLVDWATPMKENETIEFLSFSDPLGKETFWHTSAHVLAQAVLRLYPDAKPTIGPPIENGFYYDFADLEISDKDFPKIEEEMEKIVNENFTSEKVVFPTKKEAIDAFGANPYKREIINEIPDGQSLTGYRQGEFFDLCRGPHLSNLGKIKALKILKTAGAYWRGDAKNRMLTRIYAISFPDRKELKKYLQDLEEAKKRDHKILGPRLDLFSLKEEAPGMPFIHPKGMVVWNGLLSFIREKLDKGGYIEIKTPCMMTRELWEKSGHWANYRQNMFTSEIEERDFAIKPMNCPGCMLFYKSTSHSYRELPLRVAEIGNVHRYEPSGALSGLFRVRSFHQDDAHVFLRDDQIEDEIVEILKLADELYTAFGLTYHLELSTKPEKNTIGTDQEWEIATNGLRGALNKVGRPYKVNEGDGAFYGPKIDFHIRDALGRTWQCGTIQLDMALPQKFELEYTASDGSRKRPVMLHRALFGSVERFFGILIEHFAGRFPLWLSPRQVEILTVADRHVPYADELAKKIKALGFHVSVDDSNESVSKKVRNGQMNQVNYLLTIGDQEMENKTINVRTREMEIVGELSLDDFLTRIEEEKKTRSLVSSWTKAK